MPGLAAISDVSVGYGSPQVIALTQSIALHYGLDAVIFEPDQSGKQPMQDLPERCSIRRLPLTTSPHNEPGRIEYVAAVTAEINRLRPDVLIVFCTYSLPVLLGLKRRPGLTIYASIESIAAYGASDVQLNQHLAPKIDLVVFPEENRARLDSERCGLSAVPMVVTYNVSSSRAEIERSPQPDKEKRILYSGTIDSQRTFGHYYTSTEASEFPVDIYGSVEGPDREALLAALLGGGGAIRYKGYVDSRTLKLLRACYAYSIVMWAPTNENQYYAAPNKLFEAIADGVPPIAAPHPQCQLLLQRHQCGILMADWSLKAFCDALERALEIFGTPQYAEMVANCRDAALHELNWDHQFAKIRRLLPERPH